MTNRVEAGGGRGAGKGPFADYRTTPVYPEVALWHVSGSSAQPWEFSGWKPESMSWKCACYIHAGLSGNTPILYSGPDAEKFLAGICVNGFEKFRPGTAKHAVMCDEAGLIAGHGMLQRSAEDRFRLYVHGVWANYMFSRTGLRVREEVLDEYLFQVAGPASLHLLEDVSGTDLRDVRFLGFKQCVIAGRSVEIMRIGMAGGLAYEVHGPMADASLVYDAIYRAGQAHGIERLGARTYQVNHIEGGFPQKNWTFFPAGADDPGFRRWAREHRLMGYIEPKWTGSADPADHRARYRTPVEVGWQRSVNLDHDFLGRAAVEKELADPRRTIVTLAWNAEDVIDVYASLFREGEEYQFIEIPSTAYPRRARAHADELLRDGRVVGIASGAVYSYYHRRMISHGTIDMECAAIGTGVVVRWGEHGGRIKEIRATVERFPFHDGQNNREIDVAAMPKHDPAPAGG
jgi:glycine cleavage system aminomethyltransferase T